MWPLSPNQFSEFMPSNVPLARSAAMSSRCPSTGSEIQARRPQRPPAPASERLRVRPRRRCRMNSFSIRSTRIAYCSAVILVVVYLCTGWFLCEEFLVEVALQSQRTGWCYSWPTRTIYHRSIEFRISPKVTTREPKSPRIGGQSGANSRRRRQAWFVTEPCGSPVRLINAAGLRLSSFA